MATKTTKTAAPDPKREQALTLLAEGATTNEVARTLGIHRGSIYRWRTEVGFAGKLAELRRGQTESARRDIAAMVGRVVEMLGAILDDVTAPAAVRLRACELILDRAGIDGPPSDLEQPEDTPRIIRYLAETRREEVEAALAEVSS
ncbi:MAG: helix-turn-helix domain-containing protein [Myxococcales bacterium]|nr:helix-turn-helix domain-containing protein [Myxococcales bacterium]